MNKMNEGPDAAVQRVLRGDKDAFREIVTHSEVKVRIVLAAMLPDASSVDDVTQEVFLTAYMKLGEYRIGTDFDAWIKAIARNYARNEMRKWTRRRKKEEPHRVDVETLMAPAMDAFAEEADRDALAALRECIGELKDAARSVVEAFYFDRRSGRDIAREHGRPEGWVRLSLFRARGLLAQCLEGKGVIEGE